MDGSCQDEASCSYTNPSETILFLKNIIESRIREYMSFEETANYLLDKHNTSHHVTKQIWEQLQKESPEFFNNYNLRCKTVIQAKKLKDLLDEHAALVIEHKRASDNAKPSPPNLALYNANGPSVMSRIPNDQQNQFQDFSVSFAVPVVKGPSVTQNDQQGQFHQDAWSTSNHLAYNSLRAPFLAPAATDQWWPVTDPAYDYPGAPTNELSATDQWWPCDDDLFAQTVARACTMPEDLSTLGLGSDIGHNGPSIQGMDFELAAQPLMQSNGQIQDIAGFYPPNLQVQQNFSVEAQQTPQCGGGSNGFHWGGESNGLQNGGVSSGMHCEGGSNGIPNGGVSKRLQNGEGSNGMHCGGGINELQNGRGSSGMHCEGGSNGIQNGGVSNRLQNGGGSNGMNCGGVSNRFHSGGGSNGLENGGVSNGMQSGGGSNRFHSGGGSNRFHSEVGSNGLENRGVSSGMHNRFHSGGGSNGMHNRFHSGGGSNRFHSGGGSNRFHSEVGSNRFHSGGGNNGLENGGESNGMHSGGGSNGMQNEGGSNGFHSGEGSNRMHSGGGSNGLQNGGTTHQQLWQIFDTNQSWRLHTSVGEQHARGVKRNHPESEALNNPDIGDGTLTTAQNQHGLQKKEQRRSPKDQKKSNDGP